VPPVASWSPIYDNYDNAFADYIHSLDCNGANLLCVFASPERALSQVKRHIRARTGEDPKVVPLPYVSLSRTDSDFDPSRYVRAFVRRKYWSADRSKYDTVARPQPIKLTYQAQLWARNLRDIDYVVGRLITSMRGNELYINVKVPPPINELYSRFYLEGIDDASELDAGNSQRVLRRVFTFGVDAWICYAPYEVGRVEKMTTDIYESDDMEVEGDLLDSVVTEGST